MEKYRTGRQLHLVFLTLLLMPGMNLLHASTLMWTNTAGGSWGEPLNWSPHKEPAAADDVFISTDGTYTVTIDSGASANNVTLGAANGTQTLVIRTNYPAWVNFQCNGGISVQTNAEFVMDYPITCSGLTIYGKVTWLSGNLSTPVTIAAGGNLTVTGGKSKYLNTTITNYGTINWAEPNPLGGGFPAPFIYNQGSFVLQTNLNLGSPGGGMFLNGGTVLAPAGSSNLFQNNAWNLASSGTFYTETNATLDLATSYPNASMSFTSGSALSGAGITRLVSGRLDCNGQIFVNGKFQMLNNAVLYGSQTWSGTGTLLWTDGGFLGAGTSTFAPGFHVDFSGADGFNKQIDYHTNINQGTMFCTEDATIQCTGALVNEGEFIIQTNFNLSSSEGVFVNSGALHVLGGLTFVNLAFTNSGTLDLQNSSLLLYSSDSTLAPSSVQQLTLGGPNPEVALNFDFRPDGTLRVLVPAGLTITNGSSFGLISYYSVAGAFPSVELPSLPSSLVWKLVYDQYALTLQAVPAPPSVSNPHFLAGGGFQFTFSGPNAPNYTIETSTNLVDWVPVQTNSPFNGSVSFVDTTATNYSRRFYRGKIGN
jgi:hypothetical protein